MAFPSGIIHNHESDPSMTSLVMQLVERNIKGKNTLIVVTLPMTGKRTAYALASN